MLQNNNNNRMTGLSRTLNSNLSQTSAGYHGVSFQNTASNELSAILPPKKPPLKAAAFRAAPATTNAARQPSLITVYNDYQQ